MTETKSSSRSETVKCDFSKAFYHRLRYFLTPQFDLYKNIREDIERSINIRPCVEPWILDYGCGNGVGSILLYSNGSKVIGIDSDLDVIDFARSSWSHICEFRFDDYSSRDLSHVSKLYDFIVCIEVIEHVYDFRLLLKNLKKLCAGKIYISTLNHNSQHRKNAGHIGKFCVKDFRDLLSQYFHSFKIFDYTLTIELVDDSSITPMVAVCCL